MARPDTATPRSGSFTTPEATASPGGAATPFDLVLLGTGLGVYTLARAFHEEYGVVATVVTKVGEASAGSAPSFSSASGTRMPASAAIVRLMIIASPITAPRPKLPNQK